MEFRKILVPVSGTAADDEAVRLACRLSKKHKGKIWAVYIIPVKRMLPLDAEIDSDIKPAESLLDHIEDIAEETDCEISTDLIQAREVGPAIIDEAIEPAITRVVVTPLRNKTLPTIAMRMNEA